MLQPKAPHFRQSWHAPEQWFWPLLLLILTALATVQIVTIRGEAQTWDEGIEISSGYSFIRTGMYRIAVEHPPLARLLAALPLLPLNPSVPTGDPSWAVPNDTDFGRAFLYRNRVPADRMLFAARIPMVIVTALLVALLALYTRRTFGARAGLLCAFLVALDPNIIANGRIVKHDMLVTLLGFVSVLAWGEYLKGARRRWLLATGAAFGLAFMTKFSVLFVVPVYVLLWAVARWHKREPLAAGRALLALAVIGAMALPAIAALYAPEWRKLRPATRTYRTAHPEVRRLEDAVTSTTPAARWFEKGCQHLGLQDHPFLIGFTRFLNHTTRGHPAYLLGAFRETGWWYYFPVAFLLKTPLATLCVILLALVLAVWRWILSPPGWLRSLRIEWWLCAIPPVVYLLAAMTNKVDIGERYLLPVYPFVFVASAAIVSNFAWPLRKCLLPALTALLLLESASIYPHYLAFFNVAVGGPVAGPRYLLDSNLDWGQDLMHLRDYWIAHGRPKLCLLYFGTAPPEYYGVQADDLPLTQDRAGRQAANCSMAAVSATPLYGLYMPPAALDWIRARTPVARIGYSIYVYDLRQKEKL